MKGIATSAATRTSKGCCRRAEITAGAAHSQECCWRLADPWEALAQSAVCATKAALPAVRGLRRGGSFAHVSLRILSETVQHI